MSKGIATRAAQNMFPTYKHQKVFRDFLMVSSNFVMNVAIFTRNLDLAVYFCH